MDALKANTPEELYQAIGEFLQSDYSRENLIVVYEDARKCANRFPVTYSALPKVPTYNNDPLDGLQEILEWCDKSVKLVDDIVSDLDQQTINETICQLKKLRGVADSVLSLVDTKVKEQAQEEARAKVEKEYANLNEEASKTEGMLLTQLIEVEWKLKLEAQAILRRETTDAVQIYLSKDPTFKDRVSQLGNEICEVLERLNKLIGSDTSTGKLLDIYCKLKSIPLQRQFDDVGYAYSPIDDWADVICGECNRLYTSIDNVIKTFEEIQTKAKLKTDETHPQKIQELRKIPQIKPAKNGEKRGGDIYNINGDYVGQDKIGRDKAGGDINTTIPATSSSEIEMTRYDRVIKWCKNNWLICGLLIVISIVIVLGQFTDAYNKILNSWFKQNLSSKQKYEIEFIDLIAKKLLNDDKDQNGDQLRLELFVGKGINEQDIIYNEKAPGLIPLARKAPYKHVFKSREFSTDIEEVPIYARLFIEDEKSKNKDNEEEIKPAKQLFLLGNTLEFDDKPVRNNGAHYILTYKISQK